MRVLCWWSAGVASATAARVMLDRSADPVVIAYCDTSANEHPDNLRFLAECERWYGQEIVRLHSPAFADIFDVFDKTGWLVGPSGARCTTELKRNVRRAYQKWNDIQVFGYTAEEDNRARDFRRNNPECYVRFPLIDAGLSHADCRAFIKRAGIQEPAMYALGYRNNNCIGCVKGQAGYWNKIRVDFPEAFDRMAKQERKMDVAICKTEAGGVRSRVFLDELDPCAGVYAAEPEIECGVGCHAARAQR